MMVYRFQLFALIWLLVPMPTWGLDCNISFSDLAFGEVPTLSPAPVDSQMTLQYRCNAGAEELDQGSTVTLCISINSGSTTHYSSEPSGVRKLSNDQRYMAYDLFTDAARSRVWGSNFDGAFGMPPPTLQLSLATSNGGGGVTAAGSRTIFGRVFGHQSGLSVGAYTALFGAGQVQAVYDFSHRLPDCSALTSNDQLTEGGFAVSAQVAGQCTVNTTAMNFDAVSGVEVEASATAALAVLCATDTPYQISLGPGTGTGATAARRKMTHEGGGLLSLEYSLYQDANYSQVWGQTADLDTVSAIANGSLQNIVVYGKVPRQVAPLPGVYSDTVVVTVSF